MTDDERGFINAIIESPDCDTVRLVYADWLEERGQMERAEFIRLSIAHDGVPKTRTPEMPHHEWRQIRDRAESLFDWNWRDWFPSHAAAPRTLIYLIANKASINGGTECENLIVDRGFVAEIRCTLAQFMGWRCSQCRLPGRYCRECHGTGTTPGLARTLFGHHPVTRVVLDREPNEDGGEWQWASAADTSDWRFHVHRSALPMEIAKHLQGGRSVKESRSIVAQWWYPTRAAALAAASAAAVDYGRELCGHKPLSRRGS
jgi:uncharacterized protein (TIGR02996 family)